MKEQILLMPGANGTELTRSLAVRGTELAGMRVVDGLELARIALTNSGISLGGRLISSKTQTAMLAKIMKEVEAEDGEKYFVPAAYTDAKSLSVALDSLRHAADDVDLAQTLKKGKFEKKNMALIGALNMYKKELANKGLTDSATVIKRAADTAKALDESKYELVEVEGYPLTRLERRLLKKLSGGKAIKKKLTDIYPVKDGGEGKVVSVTNAYGASNEVEHIIHTIFSENIPLDKCVVAVTDVPTYSQLFAELCGRLDIPLTLGCGALMTSTYPAKLLDLCRDWATTGCFGVDSLKGMVMSEVFDRIALWKNCGLGDKFDFKLFVGAVEVAGNLRLSWDKQQNDERINTYKKVLERKIKELEGDDRKKIEERLKALEVAAKLFEELEKGLLYILESYAYIRTNRMAVFDAAARTKLSSQIKELMENGAEVQEVLSAIPQLLTGVALTQNCDGGALHVTTLERAACTMRENLFIVGLSADVFPGKPSEDYLVLDCDCDLFEKGDLPNSKERVMLRRSWLKRLTDLALALDCKVRISYSSFDASELKGKNRSSALIDLEDKLPKETEVGYYSTPLQLEAPLAHEYSNNKLPIVEKKKVVDIDPTDLRVKRKYSPTAIEPFFACPRKFMLERIIGVRRDYEDNVYEVISPAEAGILLHKVMELTAPAEQRSKEKARELAECLFEDHIAGRPPIHADAAEAEKQLFVEMVEKAYEWRGNNKVVSAEKEYDVKHEKSGVTLMGLPDSVEETPKGRLVADYKTGYSLKHKDNDVDSCLQTLIYSYIMNHPEKKIEDKDKVVGSVYRYTRLNREVSCDYNDEIEAKMSKKLGEFGQALENNKFDFPAKPYNCKKCVYKYVCGKEDA